MVEDKEKHLFFPRVWLYARTSTKDHDAVDWQLSELADWAAQEGYRGVGRSYDFASPKVIWCSGLSAMLHVVRRGEVDAVAVTWISSLGFRPQAAAGEAPPPRRCGGNTFPVQ